MTVMYIHLDIRNRGLGCISCGCDRRKLDGCDVEIDGEVFSSVGLRAKGNNSLRLVNEYGLERYSLKIEFDHFQDGNTYYGLDKLSLDSLIRTTVI